MFESFVYTVIDIYFNHSSVLQKTEFSFDEGRGMQNLSAQYLACFMALSQSINRYNIGPHHLVFRDISWVPYAKDHILSVLSRNKSHNSVALHCGCLEIANTCVMNSFSLGSLHMCNKFLLVRALSSSATNSPIVQIPQCTSPISTMHNFVAEMCIRVHISATNWCIVEYFCDASWD